MKDLIVIQTYCPDSKRKLALHSLVQNLQKIRDKYDIMIASHSPISELSMEYVDYVYIDNDNYLITDFDLTNRFWWTNKNFSVASSLIYTHSTHYAIYSLIHYVLNFSKFRNYKKIHFVEYDVVLDTDLIDRVSKKLDTYDNVIFSEDGLKMAGGYFAIKTNNFPKIYYTHNKEFILNDLREIDNKMTEDYTIKFIKINDRSTYKFKMSYVRTIDSHENDGLTWCVPIWIRHTDRLELFTFNEFGGKYDIIIDCDGKYNTLASTKKGEWSLNPLGNINNIKNIKININGVLKRNIDLNSENIEKFKGDNYLQVKK